MADKKKSTETKPLKVKEDKIVTEPVKSEKKSLKKVISTQAISNEKALESAATISVPTPVNVPDVQVKETKSKKSKVEVSPEPNIEQVVEEKIKKVKSDKKHTKSDAVIAEENIQTESVLPESELPTVRYSDEELNDFKVKILDMRKEAIDELGMLKDRLEDLTNYDFAEESMIYSMHMAEQGSEAMEKEKTYAQIQRINEYIKKLDEAVQRIHNKTYGICRVCNCLIAKERLLAVPITTLSASYKIHKKCPEDGIDLIEPVKN